jgi:spore coat polysaccharide biosynthesis protein SpsF
MLARVFARSSRATTVAQTLVATTTDVTDDPVADYCKASDISIMRGSEFDVLDRYYQAAKQSGAEVVVRITADCPVIDPQLIDDAVRVVMADPTTLGGDRFDFAANRLPPPWKRTYPIGLDTEVCTFGALERCWKETKVPRHREHVLPYLYEGVRLSAISKQLSTGKSPRGFNIALLGHEPDYGSYRWTVDTLEDMEFIRAVYMHFAGRDDFAWTELLDLMRREPQLMEINANVTHKTLRDIDARGLRG